MNQKTKKIFRNPLILSFIFIVLFLAVAFLIPNRIPAASFIELFAAIILFAYGYSAIIGEILSKKQRIWISSVFFIFIVAATIALTVSISAVENKRADLEGIMIIAVFMGGLIAIANYFLLGTFSNKFKAVLEEKK